MSAFRMMAMAVALVGSSLFAPAQACDTVYPWLCKPIPSIDPPETADPAKPAMTAPPISVRRIRGVHEATTTERSVHKRSARKSTTRQWALRARQAKIVAARAATEAAKAAATGTTRGDSAKTSNGENPAPAPTARGDTGPTTGFASMWAERSGGEVATDAGATRTPTADVTSTAPGQAAEAVPAPAPPSVAIVAQDEPNELDLAATESVGSNSFWLRGLFLAVGGLIAVGSALRFLL